MHLFSSFYRFSKKLKTVHSSLSLLVVGFAHCHGSCTCELVSAEEHNDYEDSICACGCDEHFKAKEAFHPFACNDSDDCCEDHPSIGRRLYHHLVNEVFETLREQCCTVMLPYFIKMGYDPELQEYAKEKKDVSSKHYEQNLDYSSLIFIQFPCLRC